MDEDIEILEKLVTTKFNLDYSIDNEDKEAIEHLVQAYKQLKKENEYLQNKVTEQDFEITGLKEDRRIAAEEIQEQYYVSKDKIREKIEEFNNKLCLRGGRNNGKTYARYGKALLEELLEGDDQKW